MVVDGLERLRSYVARLHPDMPAAERERRIRLLIRTPADLAHYKLAPETHRAEVALTHFWQEPTLEHAQEYTAAALPVLRLARGWPSCRPEEPLPHEIPELAPIGGVRAERLLGGGAEGVVFQARYLDSDQLVALKLNAGGEALLPALLGDDWHPNLVRVLDGGGVTRDGRTLNWVVRELGEETLHRALQRHAGHLSTSEVLDVFRVCCEAVAWLHSRGVYNWSAHPRNVLRFGSSWKITDFGRALIFAPSDHPLVEEQRRPMLEAFGADDADSREVADWLQQRHYWGHWTAHGAWPNDDGKEQRLRISDCATLANLLVDLVGGAKWDCLFRGLNKHPYFSAHYSLTRDRSTDERLSAVLNRAWRGDAGGAPLLANAGRGDEDVYDNARQLFDDVEAVFEPAVATGYHAA